FRHPREHPRRAFGRSQRGPKDVSFVVVGLNHRTVPLTVLERVTVPPALVPKALRDLAGREYLAEVALLSTCNRTEVYALCTKFHPGVADASEFLAEQAGMGAADLAEHIYSYYDEAAIAHLFGVAAGVDSVILGEGQILGQVRDALRAAEEEGTAQQGLARIFRHAIEVGKRSRAETGIAGGRCRCRRPRWRWPPSGSAPWWIGVSWSSGRGRWARAWPARWPGRVSPRSSWPVAARSGPPSWPPGSEGGRFRSSSCPGRW